MNLPGSSVFDLAMEALTTRMAVWKEWESFRRAAENRIAAYRFTRPVFHDASVSNFQAPQPGDERKNGK